MDDSNRVSCVLCQRSEETKITGALSTKDDVTAHQNCLLFSSGIYCRNTPQFDDLFGFSVEDVLIEVKRGSKLMCSKCKMKGATAGCEVKRCKKSYHYPCAVQDRAKVVEDTEEGKYGLYCTKHDQQTQKNNGSVNGRPSSFNESPTSKSQSEAGPSKRNSSAAGRPSVHSSDSNSSSSGTPSCSKRPLDCSDKQEGTPSKRKAWNVFLTDDSSNSGDNEPDSEMAIYAPIETDIDESANSVPEALFTR
ncbi:PHD finger protein 6 [Anoplopoma fimbria]|uniref:PHD finger protein 6 n=1 Tax=Anoplopoma fimbria TaxID=229290 RepID=UPI0023EDEEA2|nr:PHD finger protein 6 [Anoplopoma fimbria]